MAHYGDDAIPGMDEYVEEGGGEEDVAPAPHASHASGLPPSGWDETKKPRSHGRHSARHDDQPTSSRRHAGDYYADRDSDHDRGQPSTSHRARRSSSREWRRSRSRSRDRDRGRYKERERDRSRDRERDEQDRGTGRNRERDRGRDERDRGADRSKAYGGSSDYDRRRDRSEEGREDEYSRPNRSAAAAGSRRYKRLEQEYEAGLDGQRGGGVGQCSGSEEPEDWRRRSNKDHRPSTTVHVRGIPEACDEGDLQQLLAGFPGVKAVRLVRNRAGEGGPQHKGYAFVEFDTQANVAVLMETKARFSLQLAGQQLRVDYTQSLMPDASAGSTLDWVCQMCSAVNFSRRTECYQCSTARPANPPRVPVDSETPSAVLKVSNLPPHVSEDDLRYHFAGHAAVKDVRLVLDKFTGLPRGLAFVELASVSEAARALAGLQGGSLPGSALPLRLCYARDRFGSAQAGGPEAQEADEEAQEVDELNRWEPKAYNPDTDSEEDKDAATAAAVAGYGSYPPASSSGGAAQDAYAYYYQAGAEGAHGGGSAYGGGYAAEGTTPHQQHDEAAALRAQIEQQKALLMQQHMQLQAQQQRLQQMQAEAAALGGADAATGPSEATAATHAADPDAKSSGQAHPPQGSGFVFDAASGYYYDAASGYYWDANTQLYYHSSTNAWYMYDHATGQYTQCPDTSGGTAAGSATGQEQPVHGTAASGPTASAARRGAVIGAAPVLNAQGLLAVAAVAEEKERAQAKAAKQQAAAAAAKRSGGAAAAAAKPAAKAKPAAAAAQPPKGASAAPAVAGAATQLQGVIHRGKWSSQRGQPPP